MKIATTFLLAALLPATTAFGQLVAIGGNTGVTTVFDASIGGQNLFITVDNTHLGLGGVTGSVTSFGFNTPWDAPLDLSKIAITYQNLSLTGPTTAWNPLSEFELTAGLGSGGFTVDLGLESDANGNPNGNSVANGVEFGETVVFKLAFNASTYPIPDLDEVASFFNQGPAATNFLVRWQDVEGTTAGTSDAYRGDWPSGYDIPQGGGVPEPSTYGLFGVAALLGVVLARRLRR